LHDPVRRARGRAEPRALTRYSVVVDALKAVIESDPDPRVRDPAPVPSPVESRPYGPSETTGRARRSMLAFDTPRLNSTGTDAGAVRRGRCRATDDVRFPKKSSAPGPSEAVSATAPLWVTAPPGSTSSILPSNDGSRRPVLELVENSSTIQAINRDRTFVSLTAFTDEATVHVTLRFGDWRITHTVG
jgi:hypothetical protein